MSPSVCERLAPASIRISIMERSAWTDVVSSPDSLARPNTAPATRKFAAVLQSASTGNSAGRYFCIPRILNSMSVQYDQSPPVSMKSCPPSISFETLIPNFFSTSRVMYMYGILLGSWTVRRESFSSSGNDMSRPETVCEPCSPDISARQALSGPVTVTGTVSGFPSIPSGPVFPAHPEAETENFSRISPTPDIGRHARVPEPVTVTEASDKAADRGKTMRARSPDSPTSIPGR